MSRVANIPILVSPSIILDKIKNTLIKHCSWSSQNKNKNRINNERAVIPFLHLSIRTATMVNISRFVSLECGINYHVSVDLAQVEICFSLAFHCPKSILTCFVINYCIRTTIAYINNGCKYNYKITLKIYILDLVNYCKRSPSPTYSITNSPFLMSSSATIPDPHFSVCKQWLVYFK